MWNLRENLIYCNKINTISNIVFEIVFDSCNLLIISVICGDGRTRTAVQTPHQTAFYTLSLALVFVQGLPSDRPPKAYPLNLSGA